MNKFCCIKCRYEIGIPNFIKHIESCDGKGPVRKQHPPYIPVTDGLVCFYCGTEHNNKKSHLNHEQRCSKNPTTTYKNGFLGKTSHRKGLTKDTSEEIRKTGIKISKSLRERDWGDYIPRKGAGRGKKGWYKGYWCDSSWELAWVIYNLEHNIIFTRNNKGFKYTFESRVHRYFPDFIVNGTYIEIKGYITDQHNEKISQFLHPIVVLTKEEMNPIIKWVAKKYGKDYIRLYGAI